jgi:hypothetical protein
VRGLGSACSSVSRRVPDPRCRLTSLSDEAASAGFQQNEVQGSLARLDRDWQRVSSECNRIRAFLCDACYAQPAPNQHRIRCNSTWVISDGLQSRSFERQLTRPTPVRHQSVQAWCFVGVLP